MWAVLVGILTGFATFAARTFLAQLAVGFVFVGVATALIGTLLDAAMAHLGAAELILWFARLAGVSQALSMLGSALLFRAIIQAYRIQPASVLSGGGG